MSDSLIDRFQQSRLMVVDVDREHGRVRGEGCTLLSCHTNTVVVTENGREACDRVFDLVRKGDESSDMLKAGVLNGVPRTWKDPQRFLYDVQKGCGHTTTSWRQMWSCRWSICSSTPGRTASSDDKRH